MKYRPAGGLLSSYCFMSNIELYHLVQFHRLSLSNANDDGLCYWDVYSLSLGLIISRPKQNTSLQQPGS